MSRKFVDIENSGKAYVYEHWRPDLDVPFWVGKGTNFRYRVYKRRANTHYNGIVAKIRASGFEVEVRFVATNLTDDDAFLIEVERMQYWRDRGITFANKSEGGRGGMSGVKRSDEARKKQSDTIRKNQPPKVTVARKPRPPSMMKGTKLSDSHRAALRASKTPEVLAKISAAAKRQWKNPDFRKLVSNTMKRTNAARRNEICVE